MASQSGGGRSLPFGLGREPSCGPGCLQPDEPLPLHTPLADQVSKALSALFTTFYATSLRYLGVSEILDWLEMSGTIDAFILTGLEQGRSPADIASDKNLKVGRSAFRSVIKGALDQDDEAWATSLREVGFSSGLSMAYEGIISQLKVNKSSPLPCLHTVLTPSGLAMLKSAPLKKAFPICPPRVAPSPQTLISSIRALITSGTLSGPAWAKPSLWRPHIRRAFTTYHALVKDVAEKVIDEPSFSHEYNVFLQSISQPIQLLQLISEDFVAEFGPGASKGLLGVGEIGGQNLLQIMDFCAARRPSELLARVKARVAEQKSREKAALELETKKARIQQLINEKTAFEAEIDMHTSDDPMVCIKEMAARWQRIADLQDILDENAVECAQLQMEVAAEEARLAALEREKEKLKQQRKVAHEAAKAMQEKEKQEAARQGSSRDLLAVAAASDPFSATAPRAVSPPKNSAKGKARASVMTSIARPASRNGPFHHPLTARPVSPAITNATSRSSSPVAQRTLGPSLQTPPPSPPGRLSSKITSSASLDPSRAASPEVSLAGADDGYSSEGDSCCAMCAEGRRRDELRDANYQQSRAVAARALQASSQSEVAEPQQFTASPAVSSAIADDAESEAHIMVDATASTVNGSATTVSKKKKKKSKTARRKKDLGNDSSADLSSPTITTVLPASLDALDSLSINVPVDRFLSDESKEVLRAARPAQTFLPLSFCSPSKACPPDRCTGDKPNYMVWSQLDGLLYETFVASYKYELIYHLSIPFEQVRNQLARQYLLGGGRMTTDDGEPKDMDPFMRLATSGHWAGLLTPESQLYCQRVLAVSMVKLVQLLTTNLGSICICRLSNSPEVLANAHQRLTQCEIADRQIPVQLPPIDEQKFMLWAHGELKKKTLGGPEWQGVDRQYRVQDYLLAFTDAFDAAIDRMIADDPYVIASEFMSLLEWQGGVRTFDEAVRQCHAGIGEVGDLQAALSGSEISRPLASWGKVLSLGACVSQTLTSSALAATTSNKASPVEFGSGEAKLVKDKRGGRGASHNNIGQRQVDAELSSIVTHQQQFKQLADEQKQNGNARYGAGDWTGAIWCFVAASTLWPAEPTYYINAAAARLKLRTTSQYHEAIADCSIALALEGDGQRVKALYRRATALAAIFRWNDAVKDFAKLVELCPEDEPCKEALAWAEDMATRNTTGATTGSVTSATASTTLTG